jgi:hypothetical protein
VLFLTKLPEKYKSDFKIKRILDPQSQRENPKVIDRLVTVIFTHQRKRANHVWPKLVWPKASLFKSHFSKNSICLKVI